MQDTTTVTKKEGWIGVDLDGTLAHYDDWNGHHHIGKPIQRMVDRIKHWLALGYEVKIFTARYSDVEHQELIVNTIHDWLITEAHLPPLEVTNVKDYHMLELWDDRAVQVIPNTGLPVGGSTRGL